MPRCSTRRDDACAPTLVTGPYDEQSLLCKIAELRDAIAAVSKLSVDIPKPCAAAVRRRGSTRRQTHEYVFDEPCAASAYHVEVPKRTKRVSRCPEKCPDDCCVELPKKVKRGRRGTGRRAAPPPCDDSSDDDDWCPSAVGARCEDSSDDEDCRQRCVAETQSGARCKKWAIDGEEFCSVHVRMYC